MTDFLIKSIIPLFVLLAVYHLLLEKEKMHEFNRFYLLFSLVFSFAIPFITIEVIEEITTPIMQNTPIETSQGSGVAFVEETNYLPIIIWGIYGIITFLLSIRFMRNILKIISKINSNTRIEYKNATLVLLKEEVLPHTFLNYIFISEIDYTNQKIEAELFSHELTHVTQKHTFDVLFIEILKTIFWFNPIYIFYKKAIQLNHEFLADEKVVNSYNNIPFYQNLLLSKANENQPFYLASNLNYLLTKKRLIMMTKTTSKSRGIFMKLLLIPLISGIVFFACLKTVAQEKTTTAQAQSPKKELTKDARRDAYYAGVRIIGKNKQNNTSINKMYQELTAEEKKTYLDWVPDPIVKKEPSIKEYNDFKDSKKYAIWIDDKNVSNQTLENYSPKDFAYFIGSNVYKNARSKKFPQPFQNTLYTHNYFNKNLKNSHLKFSGKTINITIGNEHRKVNQKTMNAPETKKVIEVTKDNEVHSTATVTIKPEFPGGMGNFYKFVGENYKTPKTPDNIKLTGKVYATYIIETNGEISNIKVLRDIGYGTGEEAIRVLKLSPKWAPGKINDEAVRTTYSLPISIQSKT